MTTNLQDWLCETYLNDGEYDNLIYRNAAVEHVVFVRDIIAPMFGYAVFRDEAKLQVIGTHYSKSCLLPVYRIVNPDLEIVMRNNFFDWKVSINSSQPVPIEHGNLFDPDEELSHIYCEGFRRDDVYGSYNQSKEKFTVSICDKYDLYTFFWLVTNRMFAHA